MVTDKKNEGSKEKGKEADPFLIKVDDKDKDVKEEPKMTKED